MSKGKILIIDDDREFCQELKDFLKWNGYQVETLNNSSQAVERICKFHPKVVLLDLKMTPISGFQVADRLKDIKDRADMTIIAMTAYYNEQEHRKLMEQVGIEALVLKPITLLSVINTIENQLDKKVHKITE